MGMTALVMGAPVTWGAMLGAPIEIDARLSVGTTLVVGRNDVPSIFPVIDAHVWLRERLHRHETNVEKCKPHT